MSGSKTILAFAGSTRSGSLNKKVLAVAAEAARKNGAEVTLIDLRDFALPIYDGDQEAAEGVVVLKDLRAAAPASDLRLTPQELVGRLRPA